jgi:heparin binding hemagglutinin HbhA
VEKVINVAVSLPTSADVRKVRTQADKVVKTQLDLVRTPFLAWVGAGDLAVSKVNDAVAKAKTRVTERREAAAERAEKLQEQLADLPAELKKLNREQLRKRYTEMSDEARKRYTELADRGEETLERIRKQPRVAKVIDVVEEATEKFDKRLEQVVDDAHDAGEELLGRVSTETRSVGERAARATKQFSSEAAEKVTEISAEVAEEIEEAGDEAAHATRSATRKAANRTAPRRPVAPKTSTTNSSTGD